MKGTILKLGVSALQYAWEHPYAFDTAAIPKAVSKQLRLASAPQVKVLIWLACAGQGQFDAAACAEACGVSPSVCEECLRYWASAGFVTLSEASSAFSAPVMAPTPIPEEEPSPATTVTMPMLIDEAASAASRPSRTQVLQAKAADASFSMLLDTAAAKLGKILSPSDMSVFLYLYQELSLPAEVILMVIGYAVQNGKGKMAYIEKTAIGWAEKGITTFEAADAHVRHLEQCVQAWDTLCEWQSLEAVRPTFAQKETACRWIFEWKLSREVVQTVCEYTVEKTGKWQMSYADRIAERLHALGITTAEAAKAELTADKTASKKKKSSAARMKTAKDRAPSFDLGQYEQLARRHRPLPPKED